MRLPNFDDPQTHVDFSTWGPYKASYTVSPPFIINNNYLYTVDDTYQPTNHVIVKKDLSTGINL